MKRYSVKAYLCMNFTGLMDDLETDDYAEAQDFIWSNCQRGYNCEIIDNEVHIRDFALADKFNETTENPDELIGDLHIEQREQM